MSWREKNRQGSHAAVPSDRQTEGETAGQWAGHLSAGELPGEVDHVGAFDRAVHCQDIPPLQHTAGHRQVHLHVWGH